MASPAEWRKALQDLPSTPHDIPAFFFAHGSPSLEYPSAAGDGLASFLKDFGPALLHKYQPKGIVVFSAHWETTGSRLVTDYGTENPLLMDYYGFPSELYQLTFKSRGDCDLSDRLVQLYKEAGQSARKTGTTEARGLDGRGFEGPGLDHGVFIPFRLMFGHEFTEIPIVQVSIDSNMSPETNWGLGAALKQLRKEGILILSGGLTMHNMRDRSCFNVTTCKPIHKEFDLAVLDAVTVLETEERKQAMVNLMNHSGFQASHSREEHFVPLYVAAGAGEGGRVQVICSLYGNPTFAFGV